MAEVLTQEVRIQAVAKELNVSWTHLIETLQKKGFTIESKPTTKISREMHEVLLKEFQQDLVDKKLADKIALGSKLPKEEAPINKEIIIQPKKKTAAAEPEAPAKTTPVIPIEKKEPEKEKEKEKLIAESGGKKETVVRKDSGGEEKIPEEESKKI
ncbi:MAG TPA: hypothetical protein VE978_07495 [Chitinophagales bacterium]|nr:hypothetical protein [Chitinophagales bacterium]